MENLPLPNDLKSWSQTEKKLKIAHEKCLLAAEIQARNTEAESLSLRSKQKKPKLSFPVYCELVGEVFDNLQHACESIHGDVCPKNIFGELKDLVLNTRSSSSDLSFSTDEAQEFISSTLPCIIQLVIDLPSLDISLPKDLLTPKYLQHLKSSTDIQVYELNLLREHVCSLMAAMFLCLIPPKTSELSTLYNICDYMEFFSLLRNNMCQSQLAKLKMVLCYFENIALHGKPLGQMSFQTMVGQVLPRDLKKWSECDVVLCDMKVKDSGKIEDYDDALHVDFANEYIGGGVLSCGNVQEEIRFCISPECQVSMIFMRRMLDNHSIRIEGFQTYSAYSGYGHTLTFTGPQEDRTEVLEDGTVNSSLTAIDAIALYDVSDQYEEKSVLRELNKAYTGFYQIRSAPERVGSSPTHCKGSSSTVPTEYVQPSGLLEKDVGVRRHYKSSNAKRCGQEDEKQPEAAHILSNTFHLCKYDDIEQTPVSPCHNNSSSLNNGFNHHQDINKARAPAADPAHIEQPLTRTTVSYGSAVGTSNCESHETVSSVSGHGDSHSIDVGALLGLEMGNSLSDAAKEPIYNFALSLACSIISRSILELQARKRLLISTDVTSTEFSAADVVSEKLLEQVFLELQTEADNSISDSEKLSKIPSVATYPLVRENRSRGREMEHGYRYVHQTALSSELLSNSQHQLSPSQPSQTFTAHKTSKNTAANTAALVDVTCKPHVGKSCIRPRARDTGATASSLPKFTSCSTKNEPEATDLCSGGTNVRLLDVKVTNNADTRSLSADVPIQPHCNNSSPGVDGKAAGTQHFGAKAKSNSQTPSQLLSSPTASCAVSLTTLQYEDLRVFSDVIVENSLHSALKEIKYAVASSPLTVAGYQCSKLARLAKFYYRRHIATGNWGCGVFRGDPQLKCLLQWIAASKANCPTLIYYTFSDDRVSHRQLFDLKTSLCGKSVKYLVSLIMSYLQHKAKPRISVFQYIRDKLY